MAIAQIIVFSLPTTTVRTSESLFYSVLMQHVTLAKIVSYSA